MLAVILLQASLLAKPVYLSETPPPLRSARHVTIYHQGEPPPPVPTTRSKEEALEIAESLAARARAGFDFETLVRERSEAPNAAEGGVLGTFAPGMLAPELDRFLFTAAEGETSAPLATGSAYHVLQRIETHAGVLQILARSDPQSPEMHAAARVRSEGWLAKLRAGADFAAFAREVSEDADSAKRGGQFAIYERGRRDTLLKSAVFSVRPGTVLGPIESPIGWHLVRRVAPGEIDPALAESNFARLRAILFPYDTARGADPVSAPTQIEAQRAAERIAKRLAAGEDMVALAREHDGDSGGKERAGDLGWVHRYAPEQLSALKDAFLLRVGETTGPVPTPYGYLILRREK